jgi:hypothetical protein
VYRDFGYLKAEGIVRSRAALKGLIEKHDFPPGRLVGPNSRKWTDEEIVGYLASRPTGPKPAPPPPGHGKAHQSPGQPDATASPPASPKPAPPPPRHGENRRDIAGDTSPRDSPCKGRPATADHGGIKARATLG